MVIIPGKNPPDATYYRDFIYLEGTFCTNRLRKYSLYKKEVKNTSEKNPNEPHARKNTQSECCSSAKTLQHLLVLLQTHTQPNSFHNEKSDAYFSDTKCGNAKHCKYANCCRFSCKCNLPLAEREKVGSSLTFSWYLPTSLTFS